MEPRQRDLYIIEAACGLIVVVVIASLFYKLLTWQHFEHSSLVFIGIPAVIAIAAVLLPRPSTAKGAIIRATTVALLLSSVLFGEGFVCIIMAAPLFYAVGLIFGAIVDEVNRDRKHPPKILSCGLLLAIVPFSLEGVVPGFEVARHATVTVERVVDGSPAQVEATLARTPKFDRTLPAFFRSFRFPTPGATSGAGLEVGDMRSVEFLHSAHNTGHHPGVLTLEVRERAPQHVRFALREDTSYLTHWLSWSYADVEWHEIAPGRTRVVWTLEYRRRLDPAWYFGPLERYGVGLAAGYLIDTLATPRAAQTERSSQIESAEPLQAQPAAGRPELDSEAVRTAHAAHSGHAAHAGAGR
jgi:hypothetical protein